MSGGFVKNVPTKTISGAMRLLSKGISSPDGVASAALMQAAERLDKLYIALHDAINRPMGVVPCTADHLYDQGYYRGREKRE